MKNFIILFFCFLFFIGHSAYSANNQSQNKFAIRVESVPSGNPKKNDGLSDGAITAIALGSTFGGLGILSGIGYYFYKNSKGLQTGCACGQKCPYQTIDSKTYQDILANKKKYTYLMKASEKSIINSNYHYLIIPDTEIKAKTFNTVFFELPKTNNAIINFRIIQASKPYKIDQNLPNLDSNIFMNPKDKNVKKVPTYTKELNSDEGYLIKNGTISNLTNNILTITTENLSSKNNQIYAIIVEFWTEIN